MDNMEIWKPIPGYQGYEASSDGDIRRAEATRTNPAGYVLKTKIDRHGYRAVSLSVGGVAKHRQVHRLVCLAFHGEPQSADHEAAHGNGVRRDCRAVNLRWATAAENAADRKVHGNENPLKGEDHHAARLTEALVRAMRLRARAGERMKHIARSLGIPYLTAYDAIKGETWKHVTI